MEEGSRLKTSRSLRTSLTHWQCWLATAVLTEVDGDHSLLEFLHHTKDVYNDIYNRCALTADRTFLHPRISITLLSKVTRWAWSRSKYQIDEIGRPTHRVTCGNVKCRRNLTLTCRTVYTFCQWLITAMTCTWREVLVLQKQRNRNTSRIYNDMLFIVDNSRCLRLSLCISHELKMSCPETRHDMQYLILQCQASPTCWAGLHMIHVNYVKILPHFNLSTSNWHRISWRICNMCVMNSQWTRCSGVTTPDKTNRRTGRQTATRVEISLHNKPICLETMQLRQWRMAITSACPVPT